MELGTLRNSIDDIDKQIVDLFTQRMEISSKIADIKAANHLPIYVPSREADILERIASQCKPEMHAYITALYRVIFALSRTYQNGKLTRPDDEPINVLLSKIETVLKD